MAKGELDAVSKSVSNKITDLLECEPIAAVVSNIGTECVQIYLESELIKLAGNVNINPALNLKNHQVPVIALTLIENYKWESIEDFTLCFRRAIGGMYGEIFRLDGAVIGLWMSKYLEEKYDALEQQKHQIKHQEVQANRTLASSSLSDELKKKSAAFGAGSEYYKQAEQIAAKLTEPINQPTDNRKENDIMRKKIENPYKYFTVRGIKLMATSQEQAERIVEGMIKRGDLIEE